MGQLTYRWSTQAVRAGRVVLAGLGLMLLPIALWRVGGRESMAEGRPQKPSAYGAVVQDASVERLLRQFEKASVGNDANVKASLYAEQLDRYFLRTHVTREFVYRDLLDWLSRGRLITRFQLTVLSEGGGGDERTLVVRKEASWVDGGAARELDTRSQLILRRFGGEWRIVSERDYRPVGERIGDAAGPRWRAR